MKPIRWTLHALDNLVEREIERGEAEKALAEPECAVPGRPLRQVLMRRYFDHLLQQEMLLRIVVEDTINERVVVTVYKTSHINKYIRGLVS